MLLFGNALTTTAIAPLSFIHSPAVLSFLFAILHFCKIQQTMATALYLLHQSSKRQTIFFLYIFFYVSTGHKREGNVTEKKEGTKKKWHSIDTGLLGRISLLYSVLYA